MAGNCDATNGAGLSNAPTPGWDSFADCSSVMNICSPPTGLSSISPASGSRCGNVYETRSSKFISKIYPNAYSGVPFDPFAALACCESLQTPHTP